MFEGYAEAYDRESFTQGTLGEVDFFENEIGYNTSKTVLDDNPLLNCRINGLEKYSPVRFILDKNLDIPINSRIVKSSKKINTYVFYCLFKKKNWIN